MTNDQLRTLGRASISKLVKARPEAIPEPDLVADRSDAYLQIRKPSWTETIIAVTALLIGILLGYGCKSSSPPLKGKIGNVNVVQQSNGDMMGEDGSVYRATKWEKVK